MSEVEKVRCMISRYDETIKEAPFETIQIGEMEVEVPKVDHLGQEFFMNLVKELKLQGYRIKFYTLSTKVGFKYNVIVK
tara:strand:+ start:42 stop:278 length:237 start_codon:yes stop_codon:yes gene_type:complete